MATTPEHKPPADPKAAAAPKSKEVLSEMEQGLPSAKGEGKTEAKSERAPRDNRRIVQGVTFAYGGGETFVGDTSEDFDKLEARMTPEQCEYLKAEGAIEGDWSPTGKPDAPMPRSRAAGGNAGGPGVATAAAAEIERLRAENAALKAQQKK